MEYRKEKGVCPNGTFYKQIQLMNIVGWPGVTWYWSKGDSKELRRIRIKLAFQSLRDLISKGRGEMA